MVENSLYAIFKRNVLCERVGRMLDFGSFNSVTINGLMAYLVWFRNFIIKTSQTIHQETISRVNDAKYSGPAPFSGTKSSSPHSIIPGIPNVIITCLDPNSNHMIVTALVSDCLEVSDKIQGNSFPERFGSPDESLAKKLSVH